MVLDGKVQKYLESQLPFWNDHADDFQEIPKTKIVFEVEEASFQQNEYGSQILKLGSNRLWDETFCSLQRVFIFERKGLECNYPACIHKHLNQHSECLHSMKPCAMPDGLPNDVKTISCYRHLFFVFSSSVRFTVVCLFY
jgi:hypothetical protein